MYTEYEVPIAFYWDWWNIFLTLIDFCWYFRHSVHKAARHGRRAIVVNSAVREDSKRPSAWQMQTDEPYHPGPICWGPPSFPFLRWFIFISPSDPSIPAVFPMFRFTASSRTFSPTWSAAAAAVAAAAAAWMNFFYLCDDDKTSGLNSFIRNWLQIFFVPSVLVSLRGAIPYHIK